MTKTCTKCGETKPLSEFNKRKASKDGYNCWCRNCSCVASRQYATEHAEERRARGRRYYARNKKEILARQHKRYAENIEEMRARGRRQYHKRGGKAFQTLGVTSIDYDAMLKAQSGGCAICGRSPEEEGRRLSVDHNHTTGKIRGLLCSACNKAIGLLQDSPVLMRGAALYVESTMEE